MRHQPKYTARNLVIIWFGTSEPLWGAASNPSPAMRTGLQEKLHGFRVAVHGCRVQRRLVISVCLGTRSGLWLDRGAPTMHCNAFGIVGLWAAILGGRRSSRFYLRPLNSDSLWKPHVWSSRFLSGFTGVARTVSITSPLPGPGLEPQGRM